MPNNMQGDQKFVDGARFRITQRPDSLRYLIELVDAAGETLLTSQYREVKPMCLNEIGWMRKAGMKDNCYERVLSPEEGHTFVLHATDAHILGTGGPFGSPEEMEQVIERVKMLVAEAALEDLTPELDLSRRIPEVLQEHAREVEFGAAS